MAASARRVRVKAVIDHSSPPIWRIIDIDADLPLDAVHLVLQVAFDWDDVHLHAFETTRPYAKPRPGDPVSKRYVTAGDVEAGRRMGWLADERESDEAKVRFGRFLSAARSRASYVYDFGDDWMVRLEHRETLPVQPDAPRARVVKAKGRAPMEDSGGIGGWEALRAAALDPEDAEHEDAVDRLQHAHSGRWPVTDDVDLAELNAKLASVLGAAG